jgi:hypothetical protein
MFRRQRPARVGQAMEVRQRPVDAAVIVGEEAGDVLRAGLAQRRRHAALVRNGVGFHRLFLLPSGYSGLGA